MLFRSFFAEVAGRPAGCVGVRALPDSEGVCEMKRLYVTPEERGHGVGARLAMAAIKAAKEIGYRKILLDTLPNMRMAVKLYRELAKDVRTKEGSEAAYYVIESTFGSGDMDKTEKEVFAFSEREPQAYWLAKAFILLGDVYVRKGDNFQARATYQSVADGYSPADDGIVDEAKERIAKLN